MRKSHRKSYNERTLANVRLKSFSALNGLDILSLAVDDSDSGRADSGADSERGICNKFSIWNEITSKFTNMTETRTARPDITVDEPQRFVSVISE